MQFSEVEQNWSELEHRQSFKVRRLLQCSSCSSPFKTGNWSGAADPGRQTLPGTPPATAATAANEENGNERHHHRHPCLCWLRASRQVHFAASEKSLGR
jgi:hypothetical protein